MFRGKKYKDSAKQIDRGTLYDPKEGLDLVCKTASAKFDETVELHVKLGVDSRHADQQVRGAIVLPNGTGKTARSWVCLSNLSSMLPPFFSWETPVSPPAALPLIPFLLLYHTSAPRTTTKIQKSRTASRSAGFVGLTSGQTAC